jgi:hypothetical protein
MYFKFVKRIETTENSIFYSIIQRKENLWAVGRRNFYNERLLKIMTLDYKFNVIDDRENILVKGEDPRCFFHNNNLYIQDNYWNDMHILNVDNDYHSIPIEIFGKNISFISRKDKLYFIHYMAPFALYEIELETGEIFPVKVYHDFENYEYRGGTPGYHLYDDTYYGFGHRTYICYDNTLLHDIFYWEVDFSQDKPYIAIMHVEQPPGSLNICDPTSVIEIGGKKYLVTAESIYPWFQYQDYTTNIYEIII